MERYEDKKKNIRIIAKEIRIGQNVQIGADSQITVKGVFELGDFSRLGLRTDIKGNNVKIGENFYNSFGLRVGGGGRMHPRSNLVIGDRCTLCNNLLNICEPINIGDDVGLSEDVSLITHGFWLNVLDGYPASFGKISVGNGVIVGYRSVIMMGVEIADKIVVGSNSTVTKSLLKHGIYAGSPAKFIREITPPSLEEKIKMVNQIISEYQKVAEYHSLNPDIEINYPFVVVNKNFKVNFETLEYSGEEDHVTDDFRDYIRKWGIRIFTKRPLKSHFSFEED